MEEGRVTPGKMKRNGGSGGRPAHGVLFIAISAYRDGRELTKGKVNVEFSG